METATPSVPFSYEEFGTWYDGYADDYLLPARDDAVAALNQLLDAELDEPQRVRIRVEPGRVKSRVRTWNKLNAKYVDRVETVADIPAAMDDLVGLRVVCTNKSDVDRLVEILDGLEAYSVDKEPVLARHPDSMKDWRSDPKPSGYRAYHINLCTSVAHATTRHPVMCELQIRTLLQDSWGELTHEDTYKPGQKVPPLVYTLSRRMADLMATLDDIAEDLRTQIDSIGTEEATAGEEVVGAKIAAPVTDSSIRQAAEAFLLERIDGLTWPMPGPTLAWELQREFGGQIADGWLGFGTFTRMVRDLVPEEQISLTAPTFILPKDFDITAHSGRHPGFPRAVSLFKDAEKAFPLISSEHWPRIYSSVAAATHEVSWPGAADVKILNEITRMARDDRDVPLEDRVSRSQAGYVGLALLNTSCLVTGMTANEVEVAFVEWVRSRSESLGFPDKDSEDLENWIRGRSA